MYTVPDMHTAAVVVDDCQIQNADLKQIRCSTSF